MNNQQAINQIIQGVHKLITNHFNTYATMIYNGIVVSNNNDGKWNIQYNGETHAMKPYKITPNVGDMVKVFIPNGNQNLSFFM